MELWIRSQDRMTLCKCNNIYIDDEWVSPYYIKDDTLTLGKYSTKERALEVLDEIEKLLNPILVFKNCECDNDTLKAIKKFGACMVNNNSHIEQIQTCIYEMPED